MRVCGDVGKLLYVSDTLFDIGGVPGWDGMELWWAVFCS